MDLDKAIQEVIESMNLKPLKEKQSEALRVFISGHDTFVALPTGYGKSIIFGVLPLLFDKLLGVQGTIVVVITPLISLMIDQRDKFSSKGISTEFVGEAQEDEAAVEAVIKGNIQLVYISPESLLCNPRFRNMLLSDNYKKNLRAFVVDEAHCVKSWGDEFRKEFAELGSVRCIIPKSVKILAVTATATKETLNSVTCRLSMETPVLIGLPPDRINIKYSVKPCPSLTEFCNQITSELMSKRALTPKTVIFCRSLQNCANMFAMMKRMLGSNITEPAGIEAGLQVRLIDVFTAVSTTMMREMVLEVFRNSSTNLRILIATTAFGLGVDCPDIERIINWGSPNTLEELVQETGRGGRDGRQVDAILYTKKIGKKLTTDMREYQDNDKECRRRKLFKHFLFTESGEQLRLKACCCCDLCSQLCHCDKCVKQ